MNQLYVLELLQLHRFEDFEVAPLKNGFSSRCHPVPKRMCLSTIRFWNFWLLETAMVFPETQFLKRNIYSWSLEWTPWIIFHLCISKFPKPYNVRCCGRRSIREQFPLIIYVIHMYMYMCILLPSRRSVSDLHRKILAPKSGYYNLDDSILAIIRWNSFSLNSDSLHFFSISIEKRGEKTDEIVRVILFLSRSVKEMSNSDSSHKHGWAS